MESDSKIKLGAKAIADDLYLPGGGRKLLSRVVAGHLEWFDAAEARGLTWSDMIRLLFAAGAVGKNGKPLPVGTLSSTVWRKRAEAQEADDNDSITGRTRSSEPRNLNKISEDRAVSSSSKKALVRSVATGGIRSSRKPPGKDPVGSIQAKAKTSESTEIARGRTSSNKDALAFMKRAAATRRRSEDD
jgi:hypothetical protein